MQAHKEVTTQTKKRNKAFKYTPALENLRVYHNEMELKKAIEEYFVDTERMGEIVNRAGLRLKTELCSDNRYQRVLKRFPETMKWALRHIENAWVQQLKSHGSAGAQFYLKNAFRAEYKDTTETELSVSGAKLSELFDTARLNESIKKPDANTRQ